MFLKKKRVTKELFQTIMKDGGMLSGPLFVFRFISQKNPQYAIVAPKSVAKRAVDRNNLRRKGYNALRGVVLRGGAGIFFYKKPGINASFKDIKDDIENLIKRSGL